VTLFKWHFFDTSVSSQEQAASTFTISVCMLLQAENSDAAVNMELAMDDHVHRAKPQMSMMLSVPPTTAQQFHGHGQTVQLSFRGLDNGRQEQLKSKPTWIVIFCR
jgi:hypothetical protein